MNQLKVQGTITKILPIVSGTTKAGKEWQKMSFVIDTGAEFNPEICFSIFGGERSGEFLATNKVGDEVVVFFNLNSREWEGKYYHNVDAWRIEKAGEGQPEAAQQPAEAEDDLPF